MTDQIDTLALALDYLKRHPDRYLFPLKRGSKSQPLIKDNLAQASNDPAQIEQWAKQFKNCNWGLSLKKSGLIVMDVDTKPGKKGQGTFDMLPFEYDDLPETERTRSPSGGFHDLYEGPHVMAVGGYGADVDSPNFVVMPGCPRADGGLYVLERDVPAAKAPEWFYGPELLGKAKEKRADVGDAPLVELDQDHNVQWAKDFLKNDADPAVEGKGGDFTTLKTAMSLRDKSISFETACDLMWEIYNERCVPTWDFDDLRKKVENAYAYASQSRMGETTAQATFEDEEVDLDSIKAEIPEEEAREQNAKKAKQREKEEKEAEEREETIPPESRNEFPELSELKEQWVYVRPLRTFVGRDPIEISSGRNKCFEREMYPVPTFNDAFAFRKTKGKTASARLLEDKKNGSILRVKKLVYLPGAPQLIDGSFNLYVPSAVVPLSPDQHADPADQKIARDGLALWRAHLEYLFPDATDRGHVLNWLAWLYQHPEKKPKHAILIHGTQTGTGKSFIADVMTAILGPQNVSPVTQDDLTDGFNTYAMEAKLLKIEEIRSIDKHEITSALHTIITQEQMTVNQKNLPKFKIDNCFGIFATSNREDALQIDDFDRRWLVIETLAKPRDVTYYTGLFGLLKQPTAMAAIAHDLKTRELGDYSGEFRAPETAAKEAMKAAGADALETWMVENAGTWPLNARVITIKDVIDSVPARLARNVDNAVPRTLKRKFKGAPCGQVRVGRDRLSLWMINEGVSDAEWRGEPKRLAAIYQEEQRTLKGMKPIGAAGGEEIDVDDLLGPDPDEAESGAGTLH